MLRCDGRQGALYDDPEFDAPSRDGVAGGEKDSFGLWRGAAALWPPPEDRQGRPGDGRVGAVRYSGRPDLHQF